MYTIYYVIKAIINYHHIEVALRRSYHSTINSTLDSSLLDNPNPNIYTIYIWYMVYYTMILYYHSIL